ncbi:30S ribosomal protein S17 [cyanobacterium TDX16]|nr:30S ribosomal protein S17 [cyanobacterium TDX16]
MADETTPDTEAPAEAAVEAEAEAPAEAPAAEATPAPAQAPEPGGRARRKVREGLIISDKGDKTIVVAVTDRVRHRRYAKTVQRTTKLHAHDEQNDANVGDRVRIAETRPLSKLKRWRLVEVLERAK